ncbi:hypothetical protein ACFPFW_12680 [Flaviflagellibacter deserti]|uniref:Uncharacterized protein n=1 Tax=Flaviflagellibacter deserti TaxID=2267266 RepID=A0ABV9Z4W1_9HYPH
MALLWFGLIHPLYEAYHYRSWDWDQRRDLERDLLNPNCVEYRSRPVEDLREPAWSATESTCYRLYTVRKIWKPALPFTIDHWDAIRASEKRNAFLAMAGAFTLATLLVAGLVYFAGFLLAWIRAGFRKQST